MRTRFVVTRKSFFLLSWAALFCTLCTRVNVASAQHKDNIFHLKLFLGAIKVLTGVMARSLQPGAISYVETSKSL